MSGVRYIFCCPSASPVLNSLVTRRMDKLNPNETYTVYKVDVPDEAITGEDEDILNYDDLDDPDAFV